jgi:hypothetical protein
MKKIFFVLICLASVIGVFAQPKNDRVKDRVAAQRIGFITQRLNLTPEESQLFWPIYNQYTEKLQQIRSSAKVEQPTEDMSEADIEKLIVTQMDRESRELELKKDYYQKLKKAISVKKIAKLYKAERDFKGELLKQLQEVKQMRKETRRN